MKQRSALLFLVLLLSSRAGAQASSTREYVIRPEKSKLGISVYKGGVFKAFGYNHSVSANNISCRVLFAQKMPADSSVDLTIQAASLVIDPGESDRQHLARADYLRKGRRHLYESIDGQEQDAVGDYWPRDLADWRPRPSEMLERNETREALQSAINSLSPTYRDVVILRDVESLSIKDTSTILGIPEGSVKTRLYRARLLLRDALAPGIDGVWSTGQDYRKVRPW